MDNHTAPELLEAVGITQKTHPNLYAACCHQCNSIDLELTDAGYPSFHCQCGAWQFVEEAVFKPNFPALGTPELDAILLVAGQRWCVENWDKYDDVNDALYDGNLQAINETDTTVLEWLLFYCDLPGHALARAIRESTHA